jgi:hypothetical protein
MIIHSDGLMAPATGLAGPDVFWNFSYDVQKQGLYNSNGVTWKTYTM